jgi:hypothetical protein
MIIVSQDEDLIVNFENITTLDKEGKIIFAVDGNANSRQIGHYKTEERAKEVLQEIINKYSSYLKLNGGPAIMKGDIDIQPNIFNIPKVYYMPKE